MPAGCRRHHAAAGLRRRHDNIGQRPLQQRPGDAQSGIFGFRPGGGQHRLGARNRENIDEAGADLIEPGFDVAVMPGARPGQPGQRHRRRRRSCADRR